LSDLFWIDSASEPDFGSNVGPVILKNVHSPKLCEGRGCVMHHPSDHHMRQWPTHWRADRYLMERICEHGVAHPDPDDVAYQKSILRAWVAVHGCCAERCCTPPSLQE
jgi:hypothetical protein